MTTNQNDTDGRQGTSAKLDAVAASDLEAAPESQTSGQGTSFYNPALTGSGTILPDGTYGAPLPDPNLARTKDLPTEPEEPEVPQNVITRDATADPAATTLKAQTPQDGTAEKPASTSTKRAARN